MCIAVDDAGDRISSSNPTGGASAWSQPAGVPLPSSEAPNGLACPSTLLCVASRSYAGDVATWNPTRPTAPGTSAEIASSIRLGGVTCPSASTCFAFGYDGRLFGSAYPTGDVSAWPRLYAGGDEATDVACPAVAPCLAVDNSGNLLVGPPVSSAIVGTDG